MMVFIAKNVNERATNYNCREACKLVGGNQKMRIGDDRMVEREGDIMESDGG